MQNIAVQAVILALALTACQSPDVFESENTPPRVFRGAEYAKPEGAPQLQIAFVRKGGNDLFDRYLSRLKKKGLDIHFANKSRGVIQAHKAFDAPPPYVDCGSLRIRRGSYQGEPERVLPAAIALSRYGFTEGSDRFVVDREVRLDVFVTLEFADRDQETKVTATGLYALSNRTSAEDGSRKVVARRNETISFSTWEPGTFTNGVKCLSTGRLEKTVRRLVSPEEITASVLPAPAPRPSSPDAVAATNRSKNQDQMDGIFAGLSCASLTARVSADDQIAVFGYVASQQDLARLERDLQGIPQVNGVYANLEIQPWPFCEAIAIIDRDWLSNELVLGRQRPNLPVIFPNKADRRYRHGDQFIVWVRASRAIDGYLYVDLIDTDGTVTHLLPNSSNPLNWVAAGQTVAMGTDASRLFYTIEAPSGVNMILTLSTTKPLFNNPRPEMESAKEYVSELRTQMRRLRSSGDKGEVFGSFIFIESYTPNILSSAY